MSILKSFDELNPEQQLAWKMGYDAALREPATLEAVEAAAQAMFRAGAPMENDQYPRKLARAALEAAHNYTNRKDEA